MNWIFTLMILICSVIVNGQSVLTFREIYDFNISDEFEYLDYGHFGLFGGHKNTVIDKLISKNSDTVSYKIKVEWYRFSTRNSKPVVDYTSSIENQTYTRLDSSIGKEVREKYLGIKPGFRDSLFFLNDWGVSAYRYLYLNYASPESNAFTFGKGIGIINKVNSSFDFFLDEELGYYKKGSIQFGTKDTNYVLESKSLKFEELFSIYPNPVGSKLSINGPLGRVDRILISNYLGKSIMKISEASSISGIDVSTLNTGLYFLTFEYQGVKFINRFIKE